MQDPSMGPKATITRKELCRRAWEPPLEALAQELGVTTRKLIKIFDELQIPYPRPSHWKRKAEEKIVLQRALPSPASNTPLYIIIE